MKIEIGESLVRTWIRHCKKCQLAELNWKPSREWKRDITTAHENLYNEAQSLFWGGNQKKQVGISQFLLQAEVDVFGVLIDGCNIERIIAVDIGFHTGGILYESRSKTANVITKKLFRSALTADVYFPGVPAEIIFMSPRATPSTVDDIRKTQQALQNFFNANRYDHISVSALINDDFKIQVLDEVKQHLNKVDDTSELFLRAMQLVACSEKASTPKRH